MTCLAGNAGAWFCFSRLYYAQVHVAFRLRCAADNRKIVENVSYRYKLFLRDMLKNTCIFCIFLGVPEKGVYVGKEGKKCFRCPSSIAKLKTVGVVTTVTVDLWRKVFCYRRITVVTVETVFSHGNNGNNGNKVTVVTVGTHGFHGNNGNTTVTRR